MPTSFRPTRRELIITSVMLCVFLVLYYRKEDRNPPRQAVSDQSAGQASRQKDAVGRASGAVALMGSPRAPEPGSPQPPQPSLPAPLDPAPPISSYAPKVNGALQQARLVYKVDPIYPEALKEYGQALGLGLYVTVDEKGTVLEVVANEPGRTSQALEDAVVAAVRQWQYEPTLVNGIPASVSFNISAGFSQDGTFFSKGTSVEFDPAMFIPEVNAAGKVDSSLNYNDRAYYTATTGMSAPVVQVDVPRLQEVAKSDWPPLDVVPHRPMAFRIYINENGSIDGVMQQGGNLKIASLEEELKNIQVLSPASANGEAVPSWIMLTIDPR